MNGFALQIDDSFLKTLAEVDKQMSSLMKKKTKFSKGIVEAFQEISKSGVEPFVTKLKQTQDALNAISNVPVQGKASAKLKKLQTDASSCADNVNKLILALQGLTTSADTQREWKAFDNVQRVNKLYSERIHYMQQLESIVRKGMTSELVNTSAVTSQISTLQTKLQAIEVEIGKYNSNVKNLSRATINALTKGEADFTLAEEKELKKRLEARRKTSEEILKLENKLQKVVDKKNKLVNTAAYKSGDANAVRSYNDLIAREQDLQNKIITMRNNLGSLLAEIERKYAAEGAAKEVAEIQAAEDKKLQIAKDRMAKQLAESKKYGNISSASAMRLVGLSGNVTNVAQEQAAIEKLKQARSQLNKTDANYQQTLDALNKKIAEHEHNVKMATDATYRKAQADKATLQQNTTYQGAMSYSRQTKSIQEQIQAIDYLKQARDKLDKTTMSQKDYEESVKRLNKEIRRQQEEVDRLRDKQGALGKSHRNLMDTTGQLQRKLALLFSVSAIQGYMDKLINVRKEFELQQKSLQVLLRDKDQADKLWQQTVDLAVKSPFRVKELVSYTKQLAAYRIETSKLYDTTKMLSDVSAGLGVDMQRIILAFGQVRAANFLRGTELRQFTEAGIPMLDELAQMFTELEGRAISSGEVFERISKRMVTFKDVEKVFQRMTSESGVFYNMQEEQSKTLFGMISNLHDSIDLMLNDIGRSNEGIIKDMVALTRELVENWRGVAVILKQVGVSLGLIGIANFANGWRLASNAIVTGSTAAVMSMNVMSGSAARLRIALHTLGKSMIAHPWLLLIGSLASAGHALWEYVAAVDAANAKYDDMSRREISRIDNLEDLSKKAELYNGIIKDSSKEEASRNKAMQDNDSLLKQIKSKYPELYPLIVKQKDGTIDLTKAIEEQNKMLIENIALQQQAKGGFFQETLDENYKEAIEDFGELESSLASFKVIAMDAQAKLSQANLAPGEYEKFSELLQGVRKAKGFDELKISYNKLTQEVVKNGKEVAKQVPLLGMFASSWLNVAKKATSYKESLKDLSDNFKNQKDILKVSITDAFNNAGGGDAGANAAGEYIEAFLDKFNIVDKNIREWAKEEIPKLIKVDFKISYPERVPTPVELEPWAKRVKAAVDKINEKIKAANPNIDDSFLFPVPEPGQMKEQFLNVAKAVLDVAKATYREGQQIEEDATIKRTNILKDFASAYESILNIDDKNKGKGKDWMSEVVKSIKEAHDEYNKLDDTLGDAEAKQMALDKYAKSFAESAKNAGLKDISLAQFEFETEEGAIEALEFLKNKLPQSAKQAIFKLEEAIGEIRGELRIRTKVEDDKLLIDQIEDMFSGYEMSIELQKLNIPHDLAKKLFNLDALTLPELKDKMIELKPKFEGKKMLDKWKELMQKIDEMEDKANLERLKKFSTFLVKTTDEIANVQKQGALDITYAQNLFLGGKIDAEKYSEIIKNVVNEVNKDISKINLEKFKESPEYIAAMGDMAGYTISELSKLSNKIRDLISENAKSMTPDEIKAYNDALNKISEQVNKIKSPFGKSWLSELREINALEKKLTKEKEKQLRLQQELHNKQASLDALNKKLAELKAQPQSAGRDIQIQGVLNDITQVQKGMSNINGQLNTTAGNISSIGGKLEKVLGGMGTSVATVDKIVKGISQSIDATITIFNDFKALMDSFGVETDKGAWQDISLAMETLGEVNQKATQGWEDLKSGNIAGAVSNTLGAVMSVIKGINQIHDAKYERRIQREAEFVESLQHAYEKLEKAIEDAYSIDTLERSGKNAKDNLQSQIQSYYKMINAEEDKKDTDNDRIKEWKYQIEELKQQIEDLNKDLVSTATAGILDSVLSASQEFTNAWLEAFNETGDGLSGLKDNFKETMLEMVKQQAAMLISQSYIEKWKEQLKLYINPDDLELTTGEAKKWVNAVTTSLPQLNQALENYFTAMQQAGVDLGGGASGELSGLQRGIQSVSESTAQIIEAYLNSVRFYVADSNSKLTMIANQIVGSDETTNPMLSELRSQTELIRSIRDMFGSVIRNGHPTFGGAFIKVAL